MTPETKRQHEHSALLEGVRQCMSTTGGRCLLRWLLGQARVLRADYSPESGAMYYTEGQRSVGLALLNILGEHKPANVAVILMEETA